MANNIQRPSDFLKNFPRIAKDLGTRFPGALIAYLNTCANYCAANKSYMPSAHMMRPDYPNGIIFEQLHDNIKHKALYETSQLVLQALTSQQTNLVSYAGVEAALRDSSIFSNGGFAYLNSLLAMTGHPLYNASAPDLQPPIQQDAVNFADFFQEMVQYANLLVLGGVFINERYFIWLVVNHADRRTMGFWLRGWLTARLAHFSYEKPLPQTYTMAALYNTIATRARQEGYTRWLTTTPRELAQSSKNVLPVRSITDDPPHEVQDNPDEDESPTSSNDTLH
jgi:hypothetical protein